MPRYTDQAPISNTCPMIDDAIYLINSIDFDLNDGDEREINERVKKAVEIMEQVRHANSLLREWGNEEWLKSFNLEDKLLNAERTIRLLEGDVRELNAEIMEMEKHALDGVH